MHQSLHMKYAIALVFSIVSFVASAQNGKSSFRKVDAVFVRAEVIGVLEGRSNLAVIQIKKAPKNNVYGLEAKTELLVDLSYMYSEQAGESIPFSIKKGDVIEAEILGRPQAQSGQNEYHIMRAFRSEPLKKASNQPID